MIFDTNTLIFISKNILKVSDLTTIDILPKISVISYIEALGYNFKTDKDEMYMHKICSIYDVVNLSDAIITETIKLRKSNKIKLPDAIIYATASIEGSLY